MSWGNSMHGRSFLPGRSGVVPSVAAPVTCDSSYAAGLHPKADRTQVGKSAGTLSTKGIPASLANDAYPRGSPTSWLWEF